MDQFKTLKNHVYDYIADQIFLGKINPGEKIYESKICENLSVSRTPVREALIELSCFGVIDNIPRRGFVVRELTLRDFSELYSTIGVLEGEAAFLACPLLSDRDLADMKFYLESMKLAINQHNFNIYHKQQETFHDIFVDKCGNRVLINTLENLKKQLIKRDFNEETHPDIQEVLLETNREHERIYNLFVEKDAKGVSDFLKNVHWRTHQAQFEVL
ncbi:MAG: GntR family transcriptional regulator [Clostridiales bacterium]|nr:GntR family transcriptional regulator [Clostridiales bacterium]